MIGAILAGCALGAVYAIAAGGLIITYVSSGVLNFAYASVAFLVARLYSFLVVQHNWGIAPAAIVSILVVGPALGVLLWAVLFRFIRLASPLIKIVVTIGLSVSLQSIALLAFGNVPIVNPPGLAPTPVSVFHLAGAVITMDQIISYGCILAIFAGGAAILRWTEIGLLIRATVDSSAMSELSGIRPARVAVSVWAVSTFTAGLAGVLIAPTIGLDVDSFTVLLAGAFAAVVAAKLRNIGTGMLVGLVMGIASSLVERYLPSSSSLTAAVIPSIPFIFLVIVLVFSAIRGGALRESADVGGPLDRAIAPQGGREVAFARVASVSYQFRRLRLSASTLSAAAVVIVAALLPLLLQGLWLATLGLGLAYAIAFLSFTAVMGEGGMVWLCQITFAGIGAFTTALLASKEGWPALPAIVGGGLLCAAVGVVLGMLTIRLGDLYVALVTLTFGLLADTVVVQVNALDNYSAGVSVLRPDFAQSDRAFAWFAVVVFAVAALMFAHLRRSTFGLAVRAARWSETAARTSGVSVIAAKLGISAFGAFVAGVAGGLLALYAQAAVPGSYATFTGLTWLAVLVTVGVRSPGAAVIAGLSFGFLPAIFASYLPVSWGEIPPILFGVGAILVARNPEGVLAMHSRQLRLLTSMRHPRVTSEVGES
jgi:branched-chain amino acid transport system permease protein